MALTLGDLNIPFLPPEIHLVIAQHVHRSDLPNYRLGSRMFAEAGKPELFHTITLRSTCASVSQLKQIKQNEHLSKLVHTLIWDTNRWRVGVDVRDWHEWTRYCKLRAQGADPGQSAIYEELAASRQHWEAYLLRLEDEKRATTEIEELLLSALSTSIGLPNLQKVDVVKGAYQLNKLALPVTVALSAWKGDSLSRSSYSIYMDAILGAVKRWTFSGLTTEDLVVLSTFLPKGGVDSDPTSIAIRLGARDTGNNSNVDKNWFAVFLGQWRNLESICLDLNSRTVLANHMTSSSRTIQDTFEITNNKINPSCPEGPVTWSKLRKLSLRYFDTNSNALLSLVARHSSTLQDLRLHAMTLYIGEKDSSTWPQIFRMIGSTACLQNVALSGEFRYNGGTRDNWDFDNESLAKAVASWIINGGQCPLTDEREMWTS